LLTIWQAADPIPGDVVTDHAAAVALMPAFRGYPAVVYEDATGERHCLFNPLTLEAVTAWRGGIDNPPVVTTMSVTAFYARFTETELKAARELAKTDSDVDLFWVRVQGAASTGIDLTYPPVVKGVNYLVGKIDGFDQARADAILGVTS